MGVDSENKKCAIDTTHVVSTPPPSHPKPPPGKAAPDGAAERALALSSDPELRALHRDVVGGGLMAEEDFWHDPQRKVRGGRGVCVVPRWWRFGAEK